MKATTMNKTATKPWYREPWPWLLMAGPAIVIVAGIVTAWLAVTSSDGLVTEDYYKQGLAAGETLARSRHAEALGLQAGLRLTAEGVQVRLNGNGQVPMPDALTVMLSHPTRAGLDQQSRLRRDGEVYAGAMHLPASGHWLILIEDEARTWRLMGSVMLPAATETVIGGTAAENARQ
jgi:hypothetical protein